MWKLKETKQSLTVVFKSSSNADLMPKGEHGVLMVK